MSYKAFAFPTAKNVNNQLEWYVCNKIDCPEIPKIAQSGHTGDRAEYCDFITLQCDIRNTVVTTDREEHCDLLTIQCGIVISENCPTV